MVSKEQQEATVSSSVYTGARGISLIGSAEVVMMGIGFYSKHVVGSCMKHVKYEDLESIQKGEHEMVRVIEADPNQGQYEMNRGN